MSPPRPLTSLARVPLSPGRACLTSPSTTCGQSPAHTHARARAACANCSDTQARTDKSACLRSSDTQVPRQHVVKHQHTHARSNICGQTPAHTRAVKHVWSNTSTHARARAALASLLFIFGRTMRFGPRPSGHWKMRGSRRAVRDPSRVFEIRVACSGSESRACRDCARSPAGLAKRGG